MQICIPFGLRDWTLNKILLIMVVIKLLNCHRAEAKTLENDTMENISTDTMLQIVVTIAAALGLWLRLDSKVDGLRKEMKNDNQRVDDKVNALTNTVQDFRLETVERLTRLEERTERFQDDQSEAPLS